MAQKRPSTWPNVRNASEIGSWLLDMDGVLVREEHPIEGANRFLDILRESETPFLVLTNNSMYTRRDLSARLNFGGLNVPEDHIWTSALATAGFLAAQRPGGSAFVIGEVGLTTALHEVGYTQSENDPDYVVIGETRNYSFERITKAVRLIEGGTRFIATNPDPTGPSLDGSLPATGALTALISRATGKDPYFVGKPNPLMIRSALRELSAHSVWTLTWWRASRRDSTPCWSSQESRVKTTRSASRIDPRASLARSTYWRTNSWRITRRHEGAAVMWEGRCNIGRQRLVRAQEILRHPRGATRF